MSHVKTFVWVSDEERSSYSESELLQHHCENTKEKAMECDGKNALDISDVDD